MIDARRPEPGDSTPDRETILYFEPEVVLRPPFGTWHQIPGSTLEVRILATDRSGTIRVRHHPRPETESESMPSRVGRAEDRIGRVEARLESLYDHLNEHTAHGAP